jgi:hypothetical protein
MNPPVPLWADAQWLQYLVPLVMFSVYILNRLLGGDSPAARQQKARQQARANPPQPPVDKQRVEDEVGEFLRRAAQQKSGKQPVAPANQPIRPPKVIRKPLAEAAASVRGAGQAPPAESLAGNERPRGRAVGDSTLATRTLGDREQGDEVRQAELAMQSRLQQTFGHQVGSLAAPAAADRAAAPSPPAEPAAEELFGMLRDPQSIREAIVVSEILRRPTERW